MGLFIPRGRYDPSIPWEEDFKIAHRESAFRDSTALSDDTDDTSDVGVCKDYLVACITINDNAIWLYKNQKSLPTKSPTVSPTKNPTSVPTELPTHMPTVSPTNNPTVPPTLRPTSSSYVFTY